MDERQLQEELTRLGAPGGTSVVESLYEPVASATSGVWRVGAGSGWSAVVKVLHPSIDAGHPMWRAGLEEDHWYYWRREALALTAGLVGDATGLRMPSCLGLFDRPDGSVAVWLEDLSDAEPGSAWPIARYQPAARAVGRWQGEYVVTRAVPEFPWLSRDWLRAYVHRRDQLMAGIGVARHLDADCKEAASALWANRRDLLAFVDALPRTVCHFDLHPENLFRVDEQTVLIDWAFVGIGAVGEDPATLIADAVFDFHVPPDQLDDLAEVILDGYAAGLIDAGVDVDREALPLWVDVAMLVRYTWIFGALDEHLSSNAPLLNRRPRDEALPYWRGALTWLARRSESVLDAIG